MDDRCHWDATYETEGMLGVSWYQPIPTVSLELIRHMEIAPDDGHNPVELGRAAAL